MRQPQQTVQTVVIRKAKISIGEVSSYFVRLHVITFDVGVKIISNQADIYTGQ